MGLVFSYCSKDGEAGPQGPAGPAGPAGPTGQTGPKGDTGTANVIYSAWITNTPWKPDTVMVGSVVTDTLGFFADINAPKLTLNMLNNGELKVYVNLNTTASPYIVPLPFTNGSIFIDPAFFLNTVELYSNAQLTGLPVRYILIPGSVPGRMATVDWNNYEAVKAYLGLKD